MAGHASLEAATGALLSIHAVALREFKSLEKRVRQIGRADAGIRLLNVDTWRRPAGGTYLRLGDR